MRKALVLVAAAALLLAPTAHADPVGDLASPPRDADAYLPTPLGDPWFSPPPGFEAQSPGTVLNTRSVAVQPGTASTQLLFRSTDSKNNPIAAATTVIVPDAPWTGGGPRPVVAYNEATDSLGNACAPSYTLPRGTNKEVDRVQDLLGRGYAVVVTDYQGPRQAYSAGLVAGHTVLDGLRASGIAADAPIGITGYSGGAIASGWAAQLAPSYAPELNIVGVAFGGPPTDYSILQRSLNGGIGSGLFTAATSGLAREYPEMRDLTNDNGRRVALLQKDQCVDVLSYSGLLLLDQQNLSNVPNVFDHPVSRAVIAENRMGQIEPEAPVYIYQGLQDFLIPKEGAEAVQDQWCAMGASVHLEEIPGDHGTAETGGRPGAFDWLSQRLAGATTGGCERVVR
ncbi:lipase family protein [Rhodococcoides kyotonense]|uniref:Secretory lipase n=1 Tax=Rhodococcoides kyotonense TaxID=398843 RepID=A0A239L7Y6_9NOCA|nr:lipase family protein [Rhodococcus kyotonensis]SNT26435.1 Secretory lipase [Rhodococcus kyotonensis]